MSKLEVIAEGLVFPEGPVVMADGSVIVVEIMSKKVTRCWGDLRKETVSEPGGGPNGAAIGPDGERAIASAIALSEKSRRPSEARSTSHGAVGCSSHRRLRRGMSPTGRS